MDAYRERASHWLARDTTFLQNICNGSRLHKAWVCDRLPWILREGSGLEYISINIFFFLSGTSVVATSLNSNCESSLHSSLSLYFAFYLFIYYPLLSCSLSFVLSVYGPSSVYLIVCLSVRLSVRFSICLFVCLSYFPPPPSFTLSSSLPPSSSTSLFSPSPSSSHHLQKPKKLRRIGTLW